MAALRNFIFSFTSGELKRNEIRIYPKIILKFVKKFEHPVPERRREVELLRLLSLASFF
jgi:hypothetical protein